MNEPFDQSIDFRKPSRDHAITIWLTEADKSLYDLLKTEYDVKVANEVRKAISQRLQFLREAVIEGKSA